MNYVTRKRKFGTRKLLGTSPGDHITVVCDDKADLQSVVQICYNARDRNETNLLFRTKKNREDLFVEIDVLEEQ